MILEQYRQKAIDAYRNVSFHSERRGEAVIKDYSQELQEDLSKLTDELSKGEYRQKYERLFLTWLSAQGNCFSVMITGGSGFNNARHEKANSRERKAYENWREWRERYWKAVERSAARAEKAELDPLQEALKNAENERKLLETMKAANKILKGKTPDKLAALIELGIPEQSAGKLLVPDYAGRIGFASFSLTNCRNRMNDWQKKAELLQKNQTKENNEMIVEGVRIVQNYQENRVELYFDGKPSDAMRNELKSNGFKWTPSKGCWQNFNTNNTIYKLQKFVIPAIKNAA